ncbi:MAG TPA: SpoIIE family protein phosphatase [Acidimicrobiales bacterium]|jgi:PAS domain S-box-containing protein|nr:SpoIIE family protein phosphatase [Acidimicrobiales bacterium]
MQGPILPGREPDPAAGEADRPARAGTGGQVSAAVAEGGAGRTETRRFPATAGSVARARRFLLQHIPESCDDGPDLLALMLSELATNAVQHAATEFEVAITLGEAAPGGNGSTWVRVAVSDEAQGYPAPEEPAADAPRGRGLRIVESLADSWGIEVQRGRPGKTVWFVSEVNGPDTPPPVKTGAAAALNAFVGLGVASATPGPWPIPPVRAVLDGLRDAIVAADVHGVIHYANVAAEELLGWSHGSLVGRSALDVWPETTQASLTEGFEHFVETRVEQLMGRRLAADFKRADGSEIHTDLVLTMFDHPYAGRVVISIFNPRDDTKLQRWSELTNELLEILADAPIDDPPAERLLSTLGRHLGWDVTTLWAVGAKQDLLCRQVWTRDPDVAPAFAREKAADPRSGSEGLPRWVIEHGEPIWVPDLMADPRFMTDALAADGLKSAYAFPVRYRGTCVGVVKMLSAQQRERDAAALELVDAMGSSLGELLHASAQKAERELLVEELLDARRRNEFLLKAAQVLSEVFDYREMVERLAEVSVPVLADLCLIDIAEEDGEIRRMAARHADPSKRPLTEELREGYPPDPSGPHPTVEVMRSGRSMWSATMDDEFLRSTSRDTRHYEIIKQLGFTSYMTVPLGRPDERVIGTVTLVSAGSGRVFSERDLGLAEQLATQVSSVVSRARAYERERRISHELQRNLLPDAIPHIAGWDVAARYLPAAVGVEVGGDWYDVVPITERLVAFVVGDVEGHDLEAARIMSRLRHTLGLLVLEEQAPGKALERLNQTSLSGAQPRLATALVGVLDVESGDITFSSAGHHPPVQVFSGRAVELPVPPGPPLGVQRCHYKDHEYRIDDGCLVMFTDGLVERRGAYFDERLDQLEAALRAAPRTDPAHIADFVIKSMTGDAHRADDIVVLAARRREGGGEAAGG